MSVITSSIVDVDDDVLGMHWDVADLDALAELIAIIALGQASHASRIIQALEDRAPAISHKDLYVGARGQMRIRGNTDEEKKVSTYHRDGFLFECISWIVAR